MKYRTGFVSNSSTTSYTCCVCGEEQMGQDIGMDDAGMCGCVNGHVFCEEHMEYESFYDLAEHLKKIGEWKKHVNDEDMKRIKEDPDCTEDLLCDIFCELRGELPEEFCPCCTGKEISRTDLIAYIIKVSGKTKEEHAADFRAKFKNYGEFKKWKGD